MSEEGFRKFLEPYLRDRIPFLAYWHPQGLGLLRLDVVQIPVAPPWGWHGPGLPPTRAHQVGKRGMGTWAKNLARLRKQTWGPVVTVEFDGKTATVEGGGPEWDDVRGGFE